jgi:hypothetical protein
MISQKHLSNVAGCSLKPNASFAIRTSRGILPKVDGDQISIPVESVIDVVGVHFSWEVQQIHRTSPP